jgi:hypothetical protein
LEKGGVGGLIKANNKRRDIEWLIIYKISPDPSLLKREQLTFGGTGDILALTFGRKP